MGQISMKKYLLQALIFIVIFADFVYAEECSRPVIFPLISKPLNDTGMEYANYNWRDKTGINQAVYKSYRIRENSSKSLIKKSYHAARDLYTDVYNDTGRYSFISSKNYVVAVSDGEVISVSNFYAGTDVVVVKHTTCDGRSFILRYGELDSSSIKVKQGDKIKQGQVIGKPGFLHRKDENGKIIPIDVIADKIVFMLHLEYFTDVSSEEVFSKAFSNNRYDRRSDLEDCIDLLEEGHKNTFGEQVVK